MIKRNIPLFKVFMADTAKHEVGKVLDSGYIGQGPKVDEFESILKDKFQFDNIVTLNSGTSALHLALHLLKHKDKNFEIFDGMGMTEHNWVGIDSTNEILATPLTCTASNWPILANNFKIKWVDIDPETLNMDLDDLERKMNENTRAIVGVHWGGYPLDLDRIKEIQKNFHLKHGWHPALIEDAAHGFGSTYKGKPLGTHGNMTMYSLQAIKHVTSVDGGLLFLPHSKLYDRAKLLRWYGIDREESGRTDFRCEADISEWGFKFHMNDVNATVGIENLKHADWIIQKHKDNAKFYDENLKGVSGVQLLKREEGHDSAFWIYTMLVDDRTGFYKHMKECGITVSQVHERNDKHTCVMDYQTSLPNLEKTIGKVVSIPVGWWVSEEDRQYIVDCIKHGGW